MPRPRAQLDPQPFWTYLTCCSHHCDYKDQFLCSSYSTHSNHLLTVYRQCQVYPAPVPPTPPCPYPQTAYFYKVYKVQIRRSHPGASMPTARASPPPRHHPCASMQNEQRLLPWPQLSPVTDLQILQLLSVCLSLSSAPSGLLQGENKTRLTHLLTFQGRVHA